MKRVVLIATVLAVTGVAAPAAAAPSMNPAAPAHAGTACTNVLQHNPNTGSGGHASGVGGEHFYAVGHALCGLP